MEQQANIRLTSVMGVARALLSTVSPEESATVLIGEFGWDATFQALSLMRGEDVEQAFAVTWQALLSDPQRSDLQGPSRS